MSTHFSVDSATELGNMCFAVVFRLFGVPDSMKFKQQQTTQETHSFILLENFRFQKSQIKMQNTFSRLLIQPKKIVHIQAVWYSVYARFRTYWHKMRIKFIHYNFPVDQQFHRCVLVLLLFRAFFGVFVLFHRLCNIFRP